MQRADIRLLTLVGPPGIGKTRLAQAAGNRVASHFTHGAVMVDLAPVHNAELVPYAIAQALDLVDVPGMEVLQHLMEALAERQVLLLLDNFEHVLEAGAPVADVLAACSGVKVLATSREPLHVAWEREFPVPPLDIPDLSRLPDSSTLATYPAVALFLERGRAVRPDLELTSKNARVIAELCVRLDGLPLAIEMAAAQVKALTLEAIAQRIDKGLDVLVARVRDAPARHRTLRAAIGWSYDLLAPEEQALFRRLAVFPGGCTNESAAAVCDGDLGLDVAEGLAVLVDKSLLRPEPMSDGTSRFRLLESLREFGVERLTESGELLLIRRRHADFFLAMVEQAEPALQDHQQSLWLDLLDVEYPNMIAALQFFLSTEDAESALRLVGALWWFWYVRGRLTEGQQWLERTTAAGPSAPPALRAKALHATAYMAFGRGDFETMSRCLTESLPLYRELGDETGLAWNLIARADLYRNRDDDNLGGIGLLDEALALFRKAANMAGVTQCLWSISHFALALGDYGRARTASEEGLALSRQFGVEEGIAHHLMTLGRVSRDLGDRERAEELLQEASALFRRLGDKHSTAMTLTHLGTVLRDRGDHEHADRLFGESMTLHRELNMRGGWTAVAIRNLGIGAIVRGDRREAARLLSESLMLSFNHPRRLDVTVSLEVIAGMLAGKRPRLAAMLIGAAEGLRELLRVSVPPADQGTYERTVGAVRNRLGGKAFEAERAAGRATPLADVVAKALTSLAQESASLDAPGGSLPDPLSRREREVATLVAQGLSNRQIAAVLFIAETTVESHVQSIFNKLGFSKRAQIAAWTATRTQGSSQN